MTKSYKQTILESLLSQSINEENKNLKNEVEAFHTALMNVATMSEKDSPFLGLAGAKYDKDFAKINKHMEAVESIWSGISKTILKTHK
ncbi:MAG: hypothetical protein HOK52_14700 [Candidatus Marinimicrobia bacterium]|jgi:uncharacterized protein YukE|nr:hypothetical protein [Candidatus Neomarinimicrobiota bacterium]